MTQPVAKEHMILYKEPKLETQFWTRPELLRGLALLFADLSWRYEINPVVTRVTDPIDVPESGVHAAGRAVDFRDLQQGAKALYTEAQRKAILGAFERFFARIDGKPTLLWHSSKPGEAHFHLQIPLNTSSFKRDPFEALKEARLMADEEPKKSLPVKKLGLGAGLLALLTGATIQVFPSSSDRSEGFVAQPSVPCSECVKRGEFESLRTELKQEIRNVVLDLRREIDRLEKIR